MARGRKTGGRQKGSVNKATADIKALAAVHGPTAIEHLVALMERAEKDETRRAAANDILDRAYGKPTQAVEAQVQVFDPDALSDRELAAIIAASGGGAGVAAPADDQDESDGVVPPQRVRARKAPKAAPKKAKGRPKRRH